MSEIRIGKIRFEVWNFSDGRFAFDYKIGSKRKVVTRRTLQDLKIAAQEIAIKILNGETEAAQLTPQDYRIYATARSLLEPIGMHVDAAARDVLEVHRIVPGVSVRELALFYKRSASGPATDKKVSEVTAAVRASVLERSLSGRFTRDIKNDCNKIDGWFGDQAIGDVLPQDILEKLREHQAERKFAWRRRNHIRNSFVYVWSYAKKMHWLPQDRDTAPARVELLPEPKMRRARNYYTVPAMRAWISHIKADCLPWLITCGFTVVRSEEVAPEPGANKDRLRYEDFDWKKKRINIRPEVSKVNEQRFINMPDQFIAWMVPFRDRAGAVYPLKYPPSKRETCRVGRDSKFPWKTNVLRHTAISVLLAELQDRAEVAEQAGTSEARIRKNYNEGLPPEVASELRAIMPDYSQKILPLQLWNARSA